MGDERGVDWIWGAFGSVGGLYLSSDRRELGEERARTPDIELAGQRPSGGHDVLFL
ncbi:hypothetical protein [Parabacteroides leei]|uniref:hypothetical protein n=1 Tax=Parabacteroides leei TaxID=2939491 RepID=UPI002016C3E6|nr:hypothetical protein [Parabacteroides leei]MCL3851943.1 hypothetical protein [Parabacteroides leei]